MGDEKTKAINGTHKISWQCLVIKVQYEVIQAYHSEGHWWTQETQMKNYQAPKPEGEEGNTIIWW